MSAKRKTRPIVDETFEQAEKDIAEFVNSDADQSEDDSADDDGREPRWTPPKNLNGFNTIEYRPAKDSPAFTRVNGQTFTANRPVRLRRNDKMVEQLIPEETQMPDGTIVTKGKTRRVPLADVLANNPEFSIDGKAPPSYKKAYAGKLPTTAEQYRNYAIGWMADETSAITLEKRWDAEGALRSSVGMDDKAVSEIRPFYLAMHAKLADGEMV